MIGIAMDVTSIEMTIEVVMITNEMISHTMMLVTAVEVGKGNHYDLVILLIADTSYFHFAFLALF